MAELYLSQGHRRRAIETYRAVLVRRPDDEASRRRLAELTGDEKAEESDMSFRDHLQRIVTSVPGTISATVMGYDGISIDTAEGSATAVDMNALMAEYTQVAIQLRRTIGSMQGAGDFADLTIAAQQITCLMRPVTSEYFMAVVIGPTSMLGKARYLMRVTAPLLAKELA